MGYTEEVYKWDTWTTLAAALRPAKPPDAVIADFDCRKLRFDGLYYHDLGGGGDFLRFYPNGKFVMAAVSGEGTVQDVARWLCLDKKREIGDFTHKGSAINGECRFEIGCSKEPVRITIKGRLTKQGLKVRTWSSYSNNEIESVYAFHKVKLR
jgi:hypothetical protein